MKKASLIFMLVFMVAIIATGTSILSTASTNNTPNWEVTINIVGSGTLTVIEKEFNASSQEWCTVVQFTVNHSTSFIVPNGTAVILESNESFVVNNQGMITKFYGIEILSNTTLNVNFDVQNFTFPSSEYSNVTFVLHNSGYLIIAVGNINNTIFYTLMTINKTTLLEVPIGTVIFYYANTSFKYSNSSKYYVNGGRFIVKYPNYTIQIFFLTPTTTTSTTTTSTTTTTTSSSSTTTSTATPVTSTSPPTITITPHTGTVTPVSTSTSAKGNSTLIILAIVIVVVLAVAGYLVLKRR